MRTILSSASRAALAVAILALAATASLAPAVAQDKDAPSQEAPQPKQVPLTQKSLDNLIAAQKQIRELEAKMPKGAKGPDAKMEKQIDAVLKSTGFANGGDFADASYSVGVVLAGVDPDSGKFIGAEAATKKQIDEVKADKQMPPKEKKEALDELQEALKAASTDKPPQGNIDLVTANIAKLNEGLKQAD